MDEYTKRFRVLIRRGDGRDVRPSAEQIDGKVFIFRRGWTIEESDRKDYVGETAWIPGDPDYPRDGPPWIASGDLVSEPGIVTEG